MMKSKIGFMDTLLIIISPALAVGLLVLVVILGMTARDKNYHAPF